MPIFVAYGAHMGFLSGFYMGLPMWVPCGIYMGHKGPRRPTFYPYGPQLHYYLITHTDTTWGPYWFIIWVLYGLAHVGSMWVCMANDFPYFPHMGPYGFFYMGSIWICPCGYHVGFTWNMWSPEGPYLIHMDPSYFAISSPI